MKRSRTAVRRSAAAAVVAAGVLALAAAAPGSAASSAHDARPGDHQPYTAMDDYVRVLVYWHHHPTWGISPRP